MLSVLYLGEGLLKGSVRVDERECECERECENNKEGWEKHCRKEERKEGKKKSKKNEFIMRTVPFFSLAGLLHMRIPTQPQKCVIPRG